jgi:hypothetical protein
MGGWLGLSLNVQLDLDAAAGDLGDLGYRWFDEMSGRICPQLRQELADLPARLARSKVRYGPLGEPGSLFGVVDVDRGGGRDAERNASAAGMRWLREQFVQLLWRSHLWFGRLDERGHRSGSLLWLEVRHDEESAGWVRLFRAIRLENDFLDPQTGPGEQRRWLEALFSFADGLNPGYGHIGYSEEGATALERGFDPRQHPPQWRYPITPSTTAGSTCVATRGWPSPQELAQQLGGVDRLRDTGAFHEVRHLSRGGVWLQATPDYRDFSDEALARVFHALAPVLRPGTPRQVPQMPGEPPHRIILQDAAQVGRPS